jgi:hypothetical protein
MRVRQFAKPLNAAVIGFFVLTAFASSRALAQGGHPHVMTSQHQELTPDNRSKASALVKVVRESTERFLDVAMAEGEGYALQFGCVSGSEAGAMGLHYVNGPLVMDGELDVTRPEIVIYEPTSDGGVRLIGADYLAARS